MTEHAVLFGTTGTLVGVVTEAVNAARPASLGVVLLNSGIIHRVGPGRLYVTLARRFALDGVTTLRFDVSGVGDSRVRADGRPFEESAVLETQEAMAELTARTGVQRFVLMGVCSGAITAFRTAQLDERVVGAALINPQGFSDDPEWQSYVTHRGLAREYGRKLFSVKSWKRALTGHTKYKGMFGVLLTYLRSRIHRSHSVTKVASDLGQRLKRLTDRGVQLLFVLSTTDQGVDDVEEMTRDHQRTASSGGGGGGAVQYARIAGADHTFSWLGHRERVVEAVASWCWECWGAGATPDRTATTSLPLGAVEPLTARAQGDG